MKPFRLLMIAHRFEQQDGQGRVNYEVARGVAAAGHAVTLLTAHCAPELACHGNIRVVTLGDEWLPTQLLRDLAFSVASSLWIRDHRDGFDVVQANGFTTWEHCDVVTAHFVHTAWARSTYFPFRGTLRPQALYQRMFTWMNGLFERAVFHGAGRVVAVSDVVAQEIAALRVHAPIEVIYNGVDVQEYQPGAPDRCTFKLPADVPLALFVGDIRTSRKNLDTTLAALRDVPDLHLAVAGDTEGSPFPAMAAQWGVENRVHFLGRTGHVPALMRSVDLFVFPSRYEAHPLVVLEAMAAGLPCILAATVGSVASFRECFAVLDDPNDAEGLADLMKELVLDETKRTALGSAARQRALTLTWDRTVAGYLHVYAACFSDRSMETQ